jgi:cystathionine beta-lyase family protein involved in aluminum resistance
MPSIMVVARTANGGEAAVFLAERVTTVQLDDAHFAAQLVERLKWAGEDAEQAERDAVIRTPRIDQPRPQLR